MSTPTSEEAPPYASFFGSMGSVAAIKVAVLTYRALDHGTVTAPLYLVS